MVRAQEGIGWLDLGAIRKRHELKSGYGEWILGGLIEKALKRRGGKCTYVWGLRLRAME